MYAISHKFVPTLTPRGKECNISLSVAGNVSSADLCFQQLTLQSVLVRANRQVLSREDTTRLPTAYLKLQIIFTGINSRTNLSHDTLILSKMHVRGCSLFSNGVAFKSRLCVYGWVSAREWVSIGRHLYIIFTRTQISLLLLVLRTFFTLLIQMCIFTGMGVLYSSGIQSGVRVPPEVREDILGGT
jgi:hypothetical protein